MPDIVEAKVQQWTGASYSERRIRVESESVLDAAIEAIKNSQSATLTLDRDEKSLLIGASRGKFTVCAILGFDRIFDMRTSVPAAGLADFIEGGQSVELEKIHIVTAQQALAAAIDFFREGTVDVRDWDQQT